MRAISVVQGVDDQPVTTDDLEPVLEAALDTGTGIVVVDLRGARLTPVGLQAIAFASSAAAVNGQELLVVNVDAHTGEKLRHVGLSGTTYVAPEPITEG
jgi:CTP:molybdopterin cytidylyltransferase MocA